MIIEIVRLGLINIRNPQAPRPNLARYVFDDDGPIEIQVNLGVTAQAMWSKQHTLASRQMGIPDPKMPAIPADVLKELETVRTKALDPNRDSPTNDNKPKLELVKS